MSETVETAPRLASDRSRQAARGARSEGEPGKEDHRVLEPQRVGRRDRGGRGRDRECACWFETFSLGACRGQADLPANGAAKA